MEAFAPGDQKYLYSTIKPEYITAGVGTTVEVLKVEEKGTTVHRAQKYHFDRKNARDSMCVVLCCGDFDSCYVEIPDLSIILKTQPGDAYFFLGGDLKHRVGIPNSFMEKTNITNETDKAMNNINQQNLGQRVGHGLFLHMVRCINLLVKVKVGG